MVFGELGTLWLRLKLSLNEVLGKSCFEPKNLRGYRIF
jgi:hypothetical protein